MRFVPNKIYILLLLLLTFLVGCHTHLDRTIFEKDLACIRTEIIENHPGMYNTIDPNFKSNLEKNYQIALENLNHSAQDPEKTLQNFIASFQDVHLQLEKAQNSHNANLQKKPTHLSYQKIGDHIAWISIPTFDLADYQIKEFHTLLKLLPNLRNQKVIVFDLRGNAGGNSYFGTRIIYSLFGKGYTDYKLYKAQQNQYIEWRVSPANIVHLQKTYTHFRQKIGKAAIEVKYLTPIIKGMKKAQIKGDIFYREKVTQTAVPFSKPEKVTASIMVIIDAHCVSSSLDFIDVLKTIYPETILIGKPTRADRLYMETRPVQLPSGQRILWLPTKVFRNRLRRDNEPYQPDFLFEEVSNTQQLISFITELYKINKFTP